MQPKQEITIEGYKNLLSSQMSTAEDVTFKGVSTDLVQLLTEIETFLPTIEGEKAIATGANYFQESYFPHHLTDIKVLTEQKHIYIFVFAHERNKEWSEEFYSRVNALCAQNGIDYLTPRRETVIERKVEQA